MTRTHENQIAAKLKLASPSLLHEMIKSFTVLADTLNLSTAVARLGSTRQTVRRHINQLENAMGAPLFAVVDRRYQLTEAGERALAEALELLARGTMWFHGRSNRLGGLQYLEHKEDDWFFFQQQHPLSEVWDDPFPLFREVLRGWSLAGGDIEAPQLAHVRPYLIVYRFTEAGWICVDFGEKSFYVNWFGQDKARSSVGRSLGKMPGGDTFAQLVDAPFTEVLNTQHARFDHIFTKVPRTQNGAALPVSYKRLMLGGRFPDRSFALLSLVAPDLNVKIKGQENTEFPFIADDVRLNFDHDVLKYELTT